MTWLDFKEIDRSIKFSDLLHHLNVPYQETKKELKTDTVVISKEKNIFLTKGSNKGGSIVQFYSDFKGIDKRQAGEFLQKTFLTAPPKPKRGLPTLTLEYHSFLHDHGIPEKLAKEMDVGYSKKGIMKGKIAFKVHDENGKHIGYTGKELKKKGFFNPKGFKVSEYVYNLHRINTKAVILATSPLEALIFIAKGFPYTVSVFSKSLSAKQLEQLSQFERVCVFHETGEAIVGRIAQSCLVRLIKRNSVRELSNEAIKQLF